MNRRLSRLLSSLFLASLSDHKPPEEEHADGDTSKTTNDSSRNSSSIRAAAGARCGCRCRRCWQAGRGRAFCTGSTRFDTSFTGGTIADWLCGTCDAATECEVGGEISENYLKLANIRMIIKKRTAYRWWKSL